MFSDSNGNVEAFLPGFPVPRAFYQFRLERAAPDRSNPNDITSFPAVTAVHGSNGGELRFSGLRIPQADFYNEQLRHCRKEHRTKDCRSGSAVSDFIPASLWYQRGMQGAGVWPI